MKGTASPLDLEAKNPPTQRLLGRFWKWRFQTCAQNELALLLDVDDSDIDHLADPAILPPVSGLHDVRVTSDNSQQC